MRAAANTISFLLPRVGTALPLSGALQWGTPMVWVLVVMGLVWIYAFTLTAAARSPDEPGPDDLVLGQGTVESVVQKSGGRASLRLLIGSMRGSFVTSNHLTDHLTLDDSVIFVNIPPNEEILRLAVIDASFAERAQSASNSDE